MKNRKQKLITTTFDIRDKTVGLAAFVASTIPEGFEFVSLNRGVEKANVIYRKVK